MNRRFGIEVNEAKDASNTSIPISFFRYVDQYGTLETSFLKILELQRTDRKCIFDYLKICLQSFVDKATFCGLATDGASVKTGVHREKYLTLVTTHCMAPQCTWRFLRSTYVLGKVHYVIVLLGGGF